MLVQQFLENSADRLPEKVALVCDGQRLTYSEIESAANRLANALLASGLQRGERVVIFLPNSVELVIAIFATLKADGVFAIVNATTKKNKLRYILQNCHASVLIASGFQIELICELRREVPSLKLGIVTLKGLSSKNHAEQAGISVFDTILDHFSERRAKPLNIDLDLACLIYTSGSTGDPKGVMSDHSNVIFAASSVIQFLENKEDDIVLTVSPLSFDYGLYQLFMVFAFGGTLILEKSFAFPTAIIKLIEKERVTGFPGVPTIYAILVEMDLGPYDLSSLRYLTNTAAALPPSHITKIREKFPWAKLYSMYGLTETKRTLYLPPDQLDNRPDSVGIAIPGTEVWIVDEDGVRLNPGQVGELVVRGRHVMRGYWEDEDLTAVRFRPGPIPGERLCYTGDLFRSDEEGYFYFVSRKDDMIKSRGEKVSPIEVEKVIYGMEGVQEVAVIGIPDPVLGQAIKVFLVTNRTGIGSREVLAHCRKNLEDFMIPQFIEFVNELPKTPSGKIKKTDLR